MFLRLQKERQICAQKYILRPFTDNKVVQTVPYLVAAALALLLFPLRLDNYIYINKDERYLSLNVALYRIIRIFSLNTVKNSPDKMSVNGRDKRIDSSFLKSNALKIFNNLTLLKVIELGDYGTAGEVGAYAAAAQNALCGALFSFIRGNGGKTKLRNYIILNQEHSNVLQYVKISGVINALGAIKLLIILFAEKLHER